jgi:hypothetical protein
MMPTYLYEHLPEKKGKAMKDTWVDHCLALFCAALLGGSCAIALYAICRGM